MAHIILATLHSHGVDAELSTSKSLVKSRVLFGNLSTTIFDQSSSVPPYERCSQIMSSLATLVPENVCAKETTSGLAGTSIYTNSSNCYTYTSYEYPKSFSPPTQCCDACSIQADQVSVRYWAPETGRTLNATRTARTPYTIVSDGYTYTSPSVYVIYSNLYAQAACTLYPEGHIGPNISVATVAYDPDTLSTAKCYQEGGGGFRGWKAIDYADWYNPPANSVVATQSDCVLLGTAPVSNPGGTDLVASPQFSLPPGLSTLQPAWEEYHCSQWRFGAFDPPRALTKEVSLAPEIATPAAQPSSPFVTPTTTPTPSQGAQDPTGLDPELQHMPLLNSLDLVTTTTDKGNDVPNEDPTTAGSTTNPSPALPLPSVQGAEDSSVDPENSHQDQVPEPEPSQNAGDNISGPDPENPNQDQTPESSPSQDAGNNPSSAVPENSGQDQTTEPDPAQKNAGENPSSADQDPSQDQIPEADPSQDARVNSPSSNLVEADPILPINSSTNLVDGDTILISTPTPTPAPQFTIDNEVITANSQSQNVVQDQTTPGAAAITVFGTPISLAPSAIHLVVGSNTIFLQDADSIQLPPVIVNGATIAANGLSQFIVGDHTITPGAPAITILGTPISIPTAAAQPLTAVGSQAYRYGIDSAGDIIIASETVVPGGAAITLSGEAVSEDSNRTVLVIASGGSASTEGIGQLIAGAFGKGTAPTGNASANASMTGVAFTGEATSQRRVEEIHIAILAAGVAALAACVR